MKLALCLIWGISATWALAGVVSYKTYDLLQGKDGAGSAFVIKQDKTYFAVFSIHQFEGRKPGVEDSAGHPLSLMPAPSRRFDDVQVWELTDQSGTYPYLAYREQFTLKNRETLAIRGLEGEVVTGTVTGLGMRIFDSENGGEKLGLRLAKPLDAAGLSGAPLCKVSDGTVVGVLTGADNPIQAREVVFETFSLRGPNSPPKKPKIEKTFTITTRQGVTFTGVTVAKVDGEKIPIRHDAGVTKIDAKDLDAATRRLVTGNISLLEAVSEILTSEPDGKPGSSKFSAAVLALAVRASSEIYPLVAMPAAVMKGLPDQDSRARALAEASQKLADSFKALIDQGTILLKLEMQLLEEPAPPRERQREIEKTLLENYQILEGVLQTCRKVGKELAESLPAEFDFVYLDQLDGTTLGLEKYVLQPRRKTLQGGPPSEETAPPGRP